uniref:Putative secreted protein n=1 Tax=Ixodes ricinus TaxID=34613 RepID=A0A6B0TVL6_IXORI
MTKKVTASVAWCLSPVLALETSMKGEMPSRLTGSLVPGRLASMKPGWRSKASRSKTAIAFTLGAVLPSSRRHLRRSAG